MTSYVTPSSIWSHVNFSLGFNLCCLLVLLLIVLCNSTLMHQLGTLDKMTTVDHPDWVMSKWLHMLSRSFFASNPRYVTFWSPSLRSGLLAAFRSSCCTKSPWRVSATNDIVRSASLKRRCIVAKNSARNQCWQTERIQLAHGVPVLTFTFTISNHTSKTDHPAVWSLFTVWFCALCGNQLQGQSWLLVSRYGMMPNLRSSQG